MTALLTGLFGAVPTDREGAREAARRELSKRIYQPPRRGYIQRVIDWIMERVAGALERAGNIAPGGIAGLILLLVVAIGLIVFLRMRLGRLRPGDVLTDTRAARRSSADDYRAEAAAFAAAGHWREALRARFRAVIRELEQRGILDERAGRTAGEIAAEAATAVPAIGPAMRRAADTFNEVWYGDRPATAAAYDRMVEVDEAVRSGKNVMALAHR
ncbi:MAG: DUF4129 domain-containing protein [Mycobacteriales bacterium]